MAMLLVRYTRHHCPVTMSKKKIDRSHNVQSSLSSHHFITVQSPCQREIKVTVSVLPVRYTRDHCPVTMSKKKIEATVAVLPVRYTRRVVTVQSPCIGSTGRAASRPTLYTSSLSSHHVQAAPAVMPVRYTRRHCPVTMYRQHRSCCRYVIHVVSVQSPCTGNTGRAAGTL